MRYVITVVLLGAASAWAPAALAQMSSADLRGGLTGTKIAQPSPELPGDRALSCAQISAQMGEIMRKRDMEGRVASSKSKICSSSKTLGKQGEERKKLMTAQIPELTTAAAVGGPEGGAIVNKTQAEQIALEAKQQPERDRALAGLDSGIGDAMGVMNDPRLMRLAMLAQEKQCADAMAPPREEQPAATTDACDNPVDVPDGSRPLSVSGGPVAVTPDGATDPFVQRGAKAAKPAAQDPFAKR